MCFRNTGCFRECFRKIVRHSGLFVWVLSESWRHLRALLLFTACEKLDDVCLQSIIAIIIIIMIIIVTCMMVIITTFTTILFPIAPLSWIETISHVNTRDNGREPTSHHKAQSWGTRNDWQDNNEIPILRLTINWWLMSSWQYKSLAFSVFHVPCFLTIRSGRPWGHLILNNNYNKRCFRKYKRL